MHKYLYYAKLSFINTTAYRFSMLLSLALGPFNLAVQYFIWSNLLESQPLIAGYDLVSAMTYFVVVMLIQYFIYSGVIAEFDDFVVRGTISTELLRPVSLMAQVFFKTVGHRAMAVLLEILPISIGLGLMFGFTSLVPANIPLFLVGVAVAFSINFLWGYLLGLTGFWTKRLHGIKMISFSMFLFFTGFTFPLDILPQGVQTASAYLPFSHVIYAPAKYFTGDYGLGAVQQASHSLMLGLAWVAILFAATILLQRKAFRKYEGVGQ